LLTNLAGDHVGYLNDASVQPMVRAWLHIPEWLPPNAAQRLPESRPLIAHYRQILAFEIDEQSLVRYDRVRASEHQSDQPITDAIRATRLPNVLLCPGRFVDNVNVRTHSKPTEGSEHVMMDRRGGA